MNSDDQDITRALRQQADQIQGGPLTMADIKGKARSIQRRRTLATVAGAAAVVAVLAPVGILAMNNGDDPTPPIATGPTTTAPSTPSGPAPTYTVDLTPPAEGTTGGEPGIPIWMNGDLVAPNGESIHVGDEVTGFVRDPGNGQWAGMVFEQGEWRWTSFQSDGSVLTYEVAPSNRVGITPDGSAYAWISEYRPDGPGEPVWQLVLAGPDAQTWELTGDLVPEEGAGVAGILPDGSVVFDTAAGDVHIAHLDGTITDFGAKVLQVTSVSTATGTITAQTKANDDGTSCWATFDASGDTMKETCDYVLYEVSPDGSRIIGWDSQSDGLGPTEIHQLDATTLEPLATFEAPGFGTPQQGFFWSDMTWAGDRILASVHQAGHWELAYLGVDGIQLQRSAGKDGDEVSPPYLFGAGPLNTP